MKKRATTADILLEVRPLNGQFIRGFKFLWLKGASWFNPEVHCAQCLRGSGFINGLGAGALKQDIPIEAQPGDFFYLCGVTSPYRWNLNLHHAVRAKPGAMTEVNTHRGDIFRFHNAEHVPFDDKIARERYPNLGPEFLTCRNFQFGAQHLPIGEGSDKPKPTVVQF